MAYAKKSFTLGKNAATMQPTMARKHRHEFPEHPLARWRRAHGLSQHAVATACRVSSGSIGMIETYARVPIRQNLERLLDFTGLPTDALVLPLRFLQDRADFDYSRL